MEASSVCAARLLCGGRGTSHAFLTSADKAGTHNARLAGSALSVAVAGGSQAGQDGQQPKDGQETAQDGQRPTPLHRPTAPPGISSAAAALLEITLDIH